MNYKENPTEFQQMFFHATHHFTSSKLLTVVAAEKVGSFIFDFSIDFLFGIAPKRNKKV